VTLPRPVPPRTETRDDQGAPAATDSRILDGSRVLVVDDDPEFIDLSVMILRRAGAQVRAASSAARAYELINAWLPNVVLTDLAMPGEDGFMLASALRTIFSERRAPASFVAVTAYGTPESRARAALAGFDLYLTKPVDPVDLAAAVAGVIRKRG
jgi:CheY-like chemotaxis protein